jgi:hypothetical protein
MHYTDDGITEPTGHGEPTSPPNGVMDDESLDRLERFIMNPTMDNKNIMLNELDMVPQAGDKEPGERASAKGDLVGYIIALYGTERSLTDEEIGKLQKWFERGRKD